MGLAVSQPHCPPAEDRNLIAGSANFHGLSLRAHSVALVNVVDAFAVPYSAISTVGFHRIDCRPCVRGFYAFGGNLPTAFVGDCFAVLQGQAVIFSQFQNRADVNHFCLPLFLCVLIIAWIPGFVKYFFRIFLIIFLFCFLL